MDKYSTISHEKIEKRVKLFEKFKFKLLLKTFFIGYVIYTRQFFWQPFDRPFFATTTYFDGYLQSCTNSLASFLPAALKLDNNQDTSSLL